MTSTAELHETWSRLVELPCDTIYLGDHSFSSPVHGPPAAEPLSVVAAMSAYARPARIAASVAADTSNVRLLTDLVRTVQHLSGGRLLLDLALGAEEARIRDSGYLAGDPFGPVARFERTLEEIRARLDTPQADSNAQTQILITCDTPAMLRVAAQHADSWNTTGTPADVDRMNQEFDHWCDQVGRPTGDIERIVTIPAGDVARWHEYRDAGAQELVLRLDNPLGHGALTALAAELTNWRRK